MIFMRTLLLILYCLLTLNIQAKGVPEEAYEWHKKGIKEQINNDPVEAIEFFKMASELGDSTSMHNIGVTYYHGQGDVAQDYVEAAKWYKKAAEQGHSRSPSNLALMYSSGKGVVQSDSQAYLWSALSDKNNRKYSNTPILMNKLSPAQIVEIDKEVLVLYKKI